VLIMQGPDPRSGPFVLRHAAIADDPAGPDRDVFGRLPGLFTHRDMARCININHDGASRGEADTLNERLTVLRNL
jgi:hypothetical protein